jgi:hypothetical protein
VNHFTRVFVTWTCVALLGFGPARISVAALDSPDGPPPCGQDGVCNLAACSQDPDCPKNLPDRTAPASTALDEVVDCTATQETDIRAVAWNIADDWTNFDATIERETSFSLGKCTRDRFSRNGRVRCMAQNNCGPNGCRAGWSSFLTQTIRIYPSFLNGIATLPQADRRACLAALMTHEFTHSCDRAEGRSEAREDAAFNYWKSRFPVTSTLNINGIPGCGLD